MKKIFLLASFLMVACQSTEVETHEYELLFSTNNVGTKAINQSNVLTDNFGVFGYHSENFFMDNALYNMYGNPVGEKHYWPAITQGSDVSFIAYTPHSGNATTELDDVVIPVNALAVTAQECEDIMYAKTNVPGRMERVPLNFKHALSWLQFEAKYDTVSIDSIEITNIEFSTDVFTRGNLCIDGNTLETSWKGISTPMALNFAQTNRTLSGSDFVSLSDAFIIPQVAPTSVVITFNVKINSDNGEQSIYYYGKKVSKPINDVITTFEEGKKYVFQYLISANGVDFSVATDDWRNPDDATWQAWGHEDGAYAERYYAKGLALQGTKFMYSVNGINYDDGDYIEAKMDLRRLVRAKQNIISIGEDIANWSPSGGIEKFNLHIYFPNDVNDKRVRFSAVSNNKVGGNNRRTMGIVKSDVFAYDADTNYILAIKFDKYGFYVNGQLITRSEFEPVEAGKTPEWPKTPSGTYPDVWTYPDYFMPHFQGTLNLEFGSMEGTTRSYADYIYIMYHHNL